MWYRVYRAYGSMERPMSSERIWFWVCGALFRPIEYQIGKEVRRGICLSSSTKAAIIYDLGFNKFNGPNGPLIIIMPVRIWTYFFYMNGI